MSPRGPRSDSPTSRTLYGADALAANDIWAAGDGGTIVHYTGGSWQSVPAPDTTWLIDVSMALSQLGYIVGNFGTILRWNGASWTKIANSPTSLTFPDHFSTWAVLGQEKAASRVYLPLVIRGRP